MTQISFMTANYVAREVGYAMHGWGHGDRATNEAFAPLETYGEKLDELLGDVAALGFDAVDAGPLVRSRELEHLAMLWISLAFGGLGRDIAFRLVRR